MTYTDINRSSEHVFYKGNKEDFLIFLDDVDEYQKYIAGDTSIPMSRFIAKFDIYRNATGNGSEGILEIASEQNLNEEFGDFKSVEDEIIPKILRSGKLQNMHKD
ncbi:hypothetical protein PICMEDRAFT_73913 [Pichia membranifaciens NRRL Y-2026]|uniref:Ribosome maturation protein SDO1/SBDS N-terminal domain-containing protein n=1 Tax=Pichia membranifaciens NRRL Y-2026 TaxID=763406 RepID=A0A1E3NG77_9ASCO|nr:hypothetical protein PICMEDRAFT_73913 [Pichia membranifaciens NRRL Y-2026]ODQ45134.1 hypothetical protein PICMEDRAFT_73913 [Pichia membranifaciens NRRL Y-2026]